jgi:triacylglycerol lipase
VRAVLAAALLASLAACDNPEPGPVEKDPVIFVHGFVTPAGLAWDAMIANFEQNGYSPNETYRFGYDTTGTSNVQTARDLANYVDRVLASTGATRVDIVSHSMGGINTRYCIKFEGCAGKVDDWVSLAGANHGTDVAGLCSILLVTCQEMVPNSPVLQRLNTPPEITSGARSWTTLWTPGDGIIIPATSTIVQGANNIQLDPVLNHLTMLGEPSVWNRVRGIVDDGLG